MRWRSNGSDVWILKQDQRITLSLNQRQILGVCFLGKVYLYSWNFRKAVCLWKHSNILNFEFKRRTQIKTSHLPLHISTTGNTETGAGRRTTSPRHTHTHTTLTSLIPRHTAGPDTGEERRGDVPTAVHCKATRPLLLQVQSMAFHSPHILQYSNLAAISNNPWGATKHLQTH